ncbi:MAG: preprotein translocase subunit SecA [Actinobacteria bacterium ADurb.Bin346]|nr:MAG: preprotein translocase subunit SecA [Actinobacteria bacterium ADurb.Bin346]
MANILGSVLKIGAGKQQKKYEDIVREVNNLETKISPLTNSELASKTFELRQRFDNGESLESMLPEAFAVCREAAKRTINMRHFDVQIMGGVVLHEGKIAEMKTGEGKTLVATLPIYLNSFSQKPSHVVTVNDYLAKRDSQWMGPVYNLLGVKVGLLQHGMNTAEKIIAYNCDVVYGTNNEFGFDYLRDNMVIRQQDRVQTGHHFAIVDEVDSILIDEARTPLIISGIAYETTELYKKFSSIVPRLEKDVDYEIDEKAKTAAVTEEGVARVEKMIGVENLYDPRNYLYIHCLNQSLKAYNLFKKDVDYMIKDGEVLIVDEFTGRLMFGRRYSEGLHQAIEAKEHVKIKEENQTLATITIQNYFRLYSKLSGMTGTALTEAEEFRHIYKLETVVIPTNKVMIRTDMPDLIYKSEEAKFDAVVEDIAGRYENGQPVLVGTISIEKSERLSAMLKRRGIPHQVLNAKYHEKEAEIIALAGQKNAVTIATNMAGRGTDIVLGEGVVDLGGLHVLGTERHESRRIDNQLRGRSGRQGDPGSSQFYLSLGDDLLRLFGSDRIGWVMDRFNFPEDIPIQHPIINKSIENAQRQVESRNFEVRKHVLEYDDVMNKQREVIYKKRAFILEQNDLKEDAVDAIKSTVSGIVDLFVSPTDYSADWDLGELGKFLESVFAKNLLNANEVKEKLQSERLRCQDLKDMLQEQALLAYENREHELSAEILRKLEKLVMLNVYDNRWREHLLEMDYLKEGIGLRAYGQRDPVVEYKHEAYNLFKSLVDEIRLDIVKLLFNAKVVVKGPESDREKEMAVKDVKTRGPSDVISSAESDPSKASKPEPVKVEKIGRNDPCPCGSGKKYKKCCGK